MTTPHSKSWWVNKLIEAGVPAEEVQSLKIAQLRAMGKERGIKPKSTEYYQKASTESFEDLRTQPLLSPIAEAPENFTPTPPTPVKVAVSNKARASCAATTAARATATRSQAQAPLEICRHGFCISLSPNRITIT